MKERLLTGLVAGALFLALLYVGGFTFHFFVMILALLGTYEYVKMSNPGHIERIPLWASWSFIFTIFRFGYSGELGEVTDLIITYSFTLLVYILISKNKFTIEKAGTFLIGLIYICFGFFFFAETRAEEGFLYVLFVLVVIWVTDSGAYFVGKSIGKTKFSSISPNKTVEGVVGGTLLSIISGLLFYLATDLFDNLPYVLILTIIISVAGQVGDLIESAIKRNFNVKDSGKMLPGHGGVLDRFDSTIFVFIVIYLFERIAA